MNNSHAPTQRLDPARIRAARASNASQGGLYASRTVRPEAPVEVREQPSRGVDERRVIDLRPGSERAEGALSTGLRAAGDAGVREFRGLARSGQLAAVATTADAELRVRLSGAAYEVVWPIVFSRLTRKFELARGHAMCASGVERLADECLDRFHEDVEAVVVDVLAHARQPILHLEAWIAGRLNAATVDHHRRMRGRRGALQRPRLPRWLADALDNDPWLTTLATEILVWAGVTLTAGSETWPLESWSQKRGVRTGQWATSDPATVAREIESVLAIMRRRRDWYEAYVERPLGAKQAPVATSPVGDATGEIARPLGPADPDGAIDAELLGLAAEAVRKIDSRVARGERAEAIVVDVIRAVFGRTFTGTLDRAPYGAADPVGGLSGALANTQTVNRIVTTVLSILPAGMSVRNEHDDTRE
ncbi:hypothetical protein [Winogradskya humida]|uniref:Uncharacterized protein n=1 Tax=Winogradskya humida TaxID=113566 RepID=A0ABQ3ZZI1_9ACTN|nr:hypothetical protein [Actinoplanes humidus]GIE23783.1 hypothetical protein Ahu01nite_068850 [Actinoplanes humidus]